MIKKRWFGAVILALLIIIIWNYPSTYVIGINGKIFEKKIPLYAKACGFLYRNRMYKEIVDEIIATEKDDQKKVLAILRWIHENVRYRTPEGLKAVDDHPLNILIRQYGEKDQIEDIFTILCSYAGMKAGRKKCYNHEGNKCMILSFVYAGGRWLIFDAAENKYFFNKDGNIGSIEDYYNGNLIISDEDRATYAEFLDDSKNMDPESFIRIEEQMPFKRIQAQVKKGLIKKTPHKKPIF